MTESTWITLIALAEAALLLGVALTVVGLAVGRRRQRDAAAARTLAGRIRKDASSRRERLSERLSDERGLDAGQAQAAAADVVAAETDFLRTLLRTYRRRDSDQLARMDTHLHDVGRHYERIPIAASALAAETDGTDTGTAGEAASLQAELTDLKADLQLHRDALNRLFAEYTAMFGTEIDRNAQLSATEILERLDTGELGGRPVHAAEDDKAGSDDNRVSDEELDRLIQDL